MAVIITNKLVSRVDAKEPVVVEVSLTTDGSGNGDSDIIEVGRFDTMQLIFDDATLVSTATLLWVKAAAAADDTFRYLFAQSSDTSLVCGFQLDSTGDPKESEANVPGALSFFSIGTLASIQACKFIQFELDAGAVSVTGTFKVVLKEA